MNMFESAMIPPKNADACDNFDKCQQKSKSHTTIESGRLMTSIVCPKNVDGSKIVVDERLKNEHERSSFAFDIGCFSCKFADLEFGADYGSRNALDQLHAAIIEKCGQLYSAGHYSEAVLKGFSTVRDRMRDITGFERSTDAFGKGGLYIVGTTQDHLDEDYQQGAKYLLMAIDRFRNVRSHTSETVDPDSSTAYSYLSMCSLAMTLLDAGVSKDQ